MAQELSEDDELEELPPDVINRYACKLSVLIWEFREETKDIPVDREQIEAFADTLETVRMQAIFTEGILRMNALLQMHYAYYYYGDQDVIGALTSYPLTSQS